MMEPPRTLCFRRLSFVWISVRQRLPPITSVALDLPLTLMRASLLDISSCRWSNGYVVLGCMGMAQGSGGWCK